jgi:tetratricopeptide (TPR) repeat protein
MRMQEEAIEAFDRSIEIDPEYAGAWSDRGKMLGVLKRREEAAESLARAVLLAPHHPAPWQNKALLEEELGREADALQSYREFLKRATSDMRLQAEHAKARIPTLEARIRARGGDVSAPRVDAAALPATAAPGPGLPPELAALLGDDSWDGIAPEDVASLRAAAGDPAALSRQIGALIGRKTASAQAGAALPSLAQARLRALQGAPEPPASSAAAITEAQVPKLVPGAAFPDCMRRGEVNLNQGQPEKALGWYQQAIAGDAGSYNGWAGAAEAYYALKAYPECVSHLDKALALNPRYVIGWQRRAAALEALKLYEPALASWDKALGLAPQNLQLWNGRGLSLFYLGRYEDAIRSYEKALAIDPRFSLAKFNKAHCEERLARRDEAVKSFQQFLALAPPHLAAQIQEARKKVQELKSA